MLFDLDEDEAEMHNLIADPNYAKIRAGLQARIKSVVDYPVVAHEVASYGKSMFRQWINVTTAAGVDWRTEIHKKSLRWTPSWDFDAAGRSVMHVNAAPPPLLLFLFGLSSIKPNSDPKLLAVVVPTAWPFIITLPIRRSIAAVEKWLVEPVEVKPCRGDLVWPPQH